MKRSSRIAIITLSIATLTIGIGTAIAFDKNIAGFVRATDNNYWNHYAKVEPTQYTHGSKEFWANCSTHNFQLTAPGAGADIRNGGDFSLTAYFDELQSTDPRYIPPLSGTYDYDGYYAGLSWTDGEDLKQKLYTIIRNGYTPLEYVHNSNNNWETNILCDHKYDDFEILDVIYSPDDVSCEDTNKKWQREHAFCASLMTGSGTTEAVKKLGRATDFHNLIAASQNGNSSRGNKNYGYADKSASSYKDRTIGDGYDGYSFDTTTFEPGDKDKGRVARAIFYMATMYKETEQDDVNNVTMKGLTIVEENVPYVSGNDCAFAIGHLSDLLEWNNTFEVDYSEMQHNVSVFSDVSFGSSVPQGNRNPYIDYPDLVDYVYGSKKNQSGSLNDLTASMVLLNLDEEGISHHAIKTAKREFSIGETLTSSDYLIYQINNDFSKSSCSQTIVHSLANHTFTDQDPTPIEATVTIGEQQINYMISLNPMLMCSNYYKTLKDSSGISNAGSDVGTDQTATFIGEGVSNEQFTFNITLTPTSGSWYFRNINQDGNPIGMQMGSQSYKVTNLVITSANAFTIDEIYVKTKAGNKTSLNYDLDIYVGDEKLYSAKLTDYQTWQIIGTKLDSPKTGKIKYVFSNPNGEAISLSALAFNIVNY